MATAPFRKAFPEGLNITGEPPTDLVGRFAECADVTILAERILTPAEWTTYEEATEDAFVAYEMTPAPVPNVAARDHYRHTCAVALWRILAARG